METMETFENLLYPLPELQPINPARRFDFSVRLNGHGKILCVPLSSVSRVMVEDKERDQFVTKRMNTL